MSVCVCVYSPGRQMASLKDKTPKCQSVRSLMWLVTHKYTHTHQSWNCFHKGSCSEEKLSPEKNDWSTE